MTARDPRFIEGLSASVRGEVKAAAPLARYSTYRIGGPATLFLPASPEDAVAGLRYAHQAGVPVFPLGLGSNVLFPDAGLETLVIRLGKGLDAVEPDADVWRLGAGLPAPLAARRTSGQGWAGLQMMVGVPGSVGGGVFMNAGCHGGAWADVVTRVTVSDLAGHSRVIPAAEIPFSYRWSGLSDVIILEVDVRLRPADPVELVAEVDRLYAWRQMGTPFNQPCCGSVFKNPDAPAPSGWDRAWTAGSLLEASGLKGTQLGGAVISRVHANYFVNAGEATAADIRGLIGTAQQSVRQRFGVTLETEVKLIGARGEYLHG